MKIYLVTEATNDQADSLSERNADDRMISYWYLRNKRESFLPDYVNRGNGRYTDEEAEAVRKMSHREFFTYFLSKNNLIEKKEDE